jgi:hypothetical protein
VDARLARLSALQGEAIIIGTVKDRAAAIIMRTLPDRAAAIKESRGGLSTRSLEPVILQCAPYLPA